MYGKIFDSMYEGTLYGHWQAIVTLQQMLVLCNSEGVIDMTPQAMAARTSIPLEILQRGIEILSEPDQYSRTPGDEGRRIILMDDHRPWGWLIVNYAKYRDMKSHEEKLEADRVRIREKRAAAKAASEAASLADVAMCRNVSQPVADVAHVAVPVPEAKPKTKTDARKRATPLPPDFKISNQVKVWAERKSLDHLDEHLEHFIRTAKAKGYTYVDWDQAFMNAIAKDWAGLARNAPPVLDYAAMAARIPD